MRRSSFTSESVTEGHPDKVCDRISDSVLDAVLTNDPHGRVACEVLATGDRLVVAGEISASGDIDLEAITRQALRDIGYGGDNPYADSVEVQIAVQRQSPDIAEGVNVSLEQRRGSLDNKDALGAGDQGMVFGYANGETDEFMPLPIQLAHRMAERLASLRKTGQLPYLLPDGKTQVTVEYEGHRPLRVAQVLISSQHMLDVDTEQMTQDFRALVVNDIVPPDLMDETELLVNPSGRFLLGGPAADTGLTGRKIVVDTYGGFARHGGGAFSGKDPTKVDRSAAYAARHAAKNVVAAGLAQRCEIQIAYAIGQAHPFSILVETFGTSGLSDTDIAKTVEAAFDFRPAAIIADLNLLQPIYAPTSAYGHFGRSQFPWEALDAVERLVI